MRAFYNRRVACSVMPCQCGAGDTMPTPCAKIVFIICGDDKYTAMEGRGRVPCLLVPIILFACLCGDVILVVEECLDCPLTECAFALRGYLPL